MAEYYPPVGFQFSVKFTGLKEAENDALFQSVSGLSVDIETEEIAVGGENRFKHKLPVRTKFPNLVLKRGMLKSSELIDWCRKAIESFEFKPIDLTISLLDQDNNALMTWNIVHAYPLKWDVEEFNAMESKVVVETVELCYNYFTVIK